jgi:plasmid maintenance system killer protein
MRNFRQAQPATMIVSYRDCKTERFANGEHVKEFSGFERQAEVRLDRLEVAATLKDLAALRGNRLEALAGDRRGQYSTGSMINGAFDSSGRKAHQGRLMSR